MGPNQVAAGQWPDSFLVGSQGARVMAVRRQQMSREMRMMASLDGAGTLGVLTMKTFLGDHKAGAVEEEGQ